MRRPWICVWGVAALLAGGCLKPPTASTPRKPVAVSASTSATPRPGSSPAIDLQGPLSPLTPPTPGATPPPQQTLAAALTGKVKLPTPLVLAAGGIISDNGGGIISNNGSAVVSNNGSTVIANNGGSIFGPAQRRLLAQAAQVPVEGALVVLVDAAGRPLEGPDGKPWTARSGPDGSFAFQGTLPDANLLAAVDLGPAGLALAAVVRGREGALELDLVSSLTAAYILDRYVAAQQDRQATFNRLTARAEADTRAATSVALAPDALAKADSLQATRVVETVDRLRQGDARLNAQWEVVRKLLVVAGQIDQGNGQRAVDVALSPASIAVARDGTLYVMADAQHRLFKVKDGILQAVIGSGADGQGLPPPRDGARALDVALDYIGGICIGGDGKLYGHFNQAIWRLEDDGTLKRLHDTSTEGGFEIVPGPDNEIWYHHYRWLREYQKHDDYGYRLIAIPTDGKPTREILTWATREGVETVAGNPAQGVLWELGRGGRRKLDLATKAFGPAEDVGEALNGNEPEQGWTYGDDGTVYFVDPGSTTAYVRARAPGQATDKVVVTARGDGPFWFRVHNGADGKLYARDVRAVYRIEDGKFVRIAGTPESGGAVDSENGVALESPTGVAVGKDGVFYVGDVSNHRVLRYTPGKPVEALTDPGLLYPRNLRVTADGTLYVSSKEDYVGRIFKFAPGSNQGELVLKTGELYSADPIPGMEDFLVMPDGSLLITHANDGDSGPAMLKRFAPDGTITKVADLPDMVYWTELALAPNGQVFLKSEGDLWRLDGNEFVEAGRFDVEKYEGAAQVQRLVVDAKGRFYTTLSGAYIGEREVGLVLRLDPKTGKTEVIAGKGGKVLTGDRPDDGLSSYMDGLDMDAEGNLYVSDMENGQVKRILAAQLN